MSAGILDRNNYSQQTLDTFEIVAAYYVDIYYNYLYREAKKLKSAGKVASVTEGYKHALSAFIQSLSNPKLYKKSIIGIHNYFISIGFTSLSFGSCVDRIICEFVPDDFIGLFSSTRKRSILKTVISNIIKSFTRKIVNSHMVKIIDHHKNTDNVRILQDDLIDCLIVEREAQYQKYIYNRASKSESFDQNLADKIQTDNKKLIAEKKALNKKITMYHELCIRLKKNETKLFEQIKQYKDQIAQLQQENSDNAKIIENNMSEIRYLKSTKPAPVETESADEDDGEISNFIAVTDDNLNQVIDTDSDNLKSLNNMGLDDFS